VPLLVSGGNQRLLQRPPSYEAKQYYPTYPILLNALAVLFNVNIDDSLTTSDVLASGFQIDDTVSVSDNLTKDAIGIADSVGIADNHSELGVAIVPPGMGYLLVREPGGIDRKALLGPYPQLIGPVKFLVGVNRFDLETDAVPLADQPFLDRHPNTDDDILTMSDNIVISTTGARTLADSLTLADLISFQTSSGNNLTQDITDSVALGDAVSISIGGNVFEPVYVAPSQQGPYMRLT